MRALVQTVSRAIHNGLPTDCRTWLVVTPLFHVAAFAAMLSSLFVGGVVPPEESGAVETPGSEPDASTDRAAVRWPQRRDRREGDSPQEQPTVV